MIKNNLQKVLSKINSLNPEVQLLAVSKTKPTSAILEAYAAGQRAFGENYVQDAIEKIKALDEYNLEWHFIGKVQSNKTKHVAEYFDWVQTVADEKIAKRLNEHGKPLNICIQVNISQEPQKAGVCYEAIDELAKTINALPNLTLRGLMAIAENTKDEASVKQSFMELNNKYLALKESYSTVDTLSMGMTNDMELAIECGSTMVRVGTAIFGKREEIK